MTKAPDQGPRSRLPTAPLAKRRRGSGIADSGHAAQRRVIVVLGMHRSGTSVVTRGLQALGIALGDSLMKPVEGNNDKGFFEDMDIYRLNERLLSMSQSAWHRLAPLSAAALAGGAFSVERREAATTLSAKLDRSHVFAFKDPRTAVLMPLWRCVFEDLDLDDRYIVVVRHPLESAASLERRDGIDLTKGVLLWAKHTIEAIRETTGKPRIFVRFDRVLTAPEQELKRIARALALPVGQLDPAALATFRDEFISPELRHYLIGRNELRRSGIAPAFVVELYEALLLLVDSDPQGESIDPDFWRAIEARYDEIAPILSYADRLDKAVAETSQRAVILEKRLAEAEGKALANAHDAANSAAEAEQTKAGIATLRTEYASIQAETAALRERLGALDAALNASRERGSRAEAKLAASEQALAQADDEVRRLARALNEARADLDAARAQAAEDAALNADLEARMREAAKRVSEQEVTQLREALESQRAAAAAAQEAWQADLAALRAQAAADAALNADLEARLREAAQRVDISHLKDALDDQRAAGAATQEALQVDLAAARAQATQDAAVNAELEARLREAVERMSGRKVTSLQDALEALNASAEAAREQATAETSRLHNAIVDAESRARRSETEARDLRARLNQQEKALVQMRGARNEAEREIATLRAANAALDQKRSAFRRDMLLARAALTRMTNSLSWRVTAPLRAASRVARDPIGGSRALAARVARATWRRIPLSPATRGRIAHRMFAAAPAFFSWSSTFKAWKGEQQRRARAEAPASSDDISEPAPDPSLEGYVPLMATSAPREVSARAIAFYLPQYHPIPENDAWWGEGFTEWVKVRAAKPHFEGHYQPHEPDDALGYYDLVRQPEIMARQAELAKLHGISGFCFYFYWFAGKRLLERPLQNLLRAPSIDMPFCLCWANENWTRRWDGKANEVLIAQDHSADDDIAFIAHVSQYFADPRYIRIDGRPLLVVYRPALLPSASRTAQRWRQWLRKNGFGDVYLAYTQSFEHAPPTEYGFDAAIEFPPNNMGLVDEPTLVQPLEAKGSLSIYDWRKLSSVGRRYKTPPYRLFRGVTPSWDNTARRPNDGAVLVHATPSAFQAWLANAVRDTQRRFENPQERLIFINAWNEWAEGAHLEPDKRHGYAWLEAARRALAPGAERPGVLVVTHDLYQHGAQMIARDLAHTLRTRFGCDVATVSGLNGPMAGAFRNEGPLHVLDRNVLDDAQIDAAVAALAAQGYRHAVINSAASAWIAPYLAKHGIAHVGLVHELPGIIQSRSLSEPLRALDASARAVVFPATVVRDHARDATGLPAWRAAEVRPQGLYKTGCVVDLTEKERARARVADRLGLPAHARFVLGVGYADYRKGADIFVQWAKAAAARWPDVHFVWVGESAPDFKATLDQHLANARADDARVHFPGFFEDTSDFYAGAILYALSSREDPFPSTALEALAAATPVLMIKGAGGIEDLVVHGCVAASDAAPQAFVSGAARWLDDAQANRVAGLAGRDLVRARFGSISYAGAVADLLGLKLPDISVVVPNYNYAHCLEQRLGSILEQTLAPREVLFLDDASSDDSVEVAERILSRSGVNWRIVRNAQNSGSVFAQWRKGAEHAQGDLLWIAEADDWADPHFLEAASKPFQREDVVLSMTQSKQADREGRVIAADYLDYVRDVSPDKWTRAFTADGPDEVRAGLSIKNTIPNVSAVLFRRQRLLETLTRHARDIATYRVAGDWCVYANLLREGAIAFTPAALNYHRRHDQSVTISRFGLKELAEIARMQGYVAKEFGVGETQARQARAYLEALVTEFGLARRWAPAQIEGAMRGIAAA